MLWGVYMSAVAYFEFFGNYGVYSSRIQRRNQIEAMVLSPWLWFNIFFFIISLSLSLSHYVNLFLLSLFWYYNVTLYSIIWLFLIIKYNNLYHLNSHMYPCSRFYHLCFLILALRGSSVPILPSVNTLLSKVYIK